MLFAMIVVCENFWLLVNIIIRQYTRRVQGKYVNGRVVYGASEIGIGREGISMLFKILNMPLFHEPKILGAVYMRMPYFKRIVE